MHKLYLITSLTRFRVYYCNDLRVLCQEPEQRHSDVDFVFPKTRLHVVLITSELAIRVRVERASNQYFIVDETSWAGARGVKSMTDYLAIKGVTKMFSVEQVALATATPPFIVFWNMIGGDRKNRDIQLIEQPDGTFGSPWVKLPDDSNPLDIVRLMNDALRPIVGNMNMHWEFFSFIEMPDKSISHRALVVRTWLGATIPGMTRIRVANMTSEFMSSTYLHQLTSRGNG